MNMKVAMMGVFVVGIGSFHGLSAAVVPGNISWTAGANAGEYEAVVIQEPGGDHTGVWFRHTVPFPWQPGALEAFSWNVDESSDWYLASAGAAFTASSIAAGEFAPILTPDTPAPPLPLPSGEFYLGVNTGVGFAAGERSAFGWVHLRNEYHVNHRELVLLGGAMAYGEQGIYVGTLTAVPEPGMLALVGLASLFLGRRPRGRGRGAVTASEPEMP